MADLRLRQPSKGYRYSLDPFLLSGFVDRTAKVAVDLGTGSGILPILLCSRFPALSMTGLELQPELAELARCNVVDNGLAGQVRILDGDVRNCCSLFPPQSVDLVVSNPPYRPPGSGRVAPDRQRAAARHEQAGGLREFVAAAAYLLGSGGRFCLIHLAERLAELLAELRLARLEPKRLRLVHSRPADEARLVLVEARRDGRSGVRVEAPLYVYDGEGYSRDVLDCYPGLEGVAAGLGQD